MRIFCVLLLFSSCFANQISWDNTCTGTHFWSDSCWIPNAPNPGDSVYIALANLQLTASSSVTVSDVTVVSGSVSFTELSASNLYTSGIVSISLSSHLKNISIASGGTFYANAAISTDYLTLKNFNSSLRVYNSGSLTVDKQFNWSDQSFLVGGTTDDLVLTSNCITTVTAGSATSPSMSQFFLRNYGKFFLASTVAQITMDTTSHFVNNGTIRFTDSESTTVFGGTSSSNFVNYGTIDVSIPNAKTIRLVNFSNFNTFNLNSGTVSLEGNCVQSGNVSMTTMSILSVSNGGFTAFTSSSVVSPGPAVQVLNGAKVNVKGSFLSGIVVYNSSADLAITPAFLTLFGNSSATILNAASIDSVAINGASTLNLNANLNVVSKFNLTGSGAIFGPGVLTLGSNSISYLSSKKGSFFSTPNIINNGTLTIDITGNGQTIWNTSLVINNGILKIANYMGPNAYFGSAQIINNGKISSSASVFTFNSLNNNGQFSVDAGTIKISGGNHTGSFSGNITFEKTHNFSPSANLSSGFTFGQGQFNINFPLAGVSFSILKNADIVFNSPIDIHSIFLPTQASLTFNSGDNFIDYLQLQPLSQVNLVNVQLFVSNLVFNKSNINPSGKRFPVGGGALIVDTSFTFLVDNTVSLSNVYIYNLGNMSYQGDSNPSIDAASLINNKTMTLSASDMSFSQFINSGDVTVTFATMSISNMYNYGTLTTAGNITFTNCILNGQITGLAFSIGDSVLEGNLQLNTNEVIGFDGLVTVNSVLNKNFVTLSDGARVVLNTPFTLTSSPLVLYNSRVEFKGNTVIDTLTLWGDTQISVPGITMNVTTFIVYNDSAIVDASAPGIINILKSAVFISEQYYIFGDNNTVNMYGTANVKMEGGQWYCVWNNYGTLTISAKSLQLITLYNYNNAVINVTSGHLIVTGYLHSGKILAPTADIKLQNVQFDANTAIVAYNLTVTYSDYEIEFQGPLTVLNLFEIETDTRINSDFVCNGLVHVSTSTSLAFYGNMTVTNMNLQKSSNLYTHQSACIANLYQGDSAIISPSKNLTISDSWYSGGSIDGTVILMSTCNTTFEGGANILDIHNMGDFYLLSQLNGNDINIINHRGGNLFIEINMYSKIDVINYGTVQTTRPGVYWNNDGKLTNYNNCDLSQMGSPVFTTIVQMYGTTWTLGGSFDVEIYGGYLMANDSIYGDVDHYAGSLMLGNGVGTLFISGDYHQHSENATIEMDLVSDTVYDKLSAGNIFLEGNIKFKDNAISVNISDMFTAVLVTGTPAAIFSTNKLDIIVNTTNIIVTVGNGVAAYTCASCVNGDCIADGNCRCYPGFSGTDCNTISCIGCIYGTCSTNGTCACQPNYYGTKCDILVECTTTVLCNDSKAINYLLPGDCVYPPTTTTTTGATTEISTSATITTTGEAVTGAKKSKTTGIVLGVVFGVLGLLGIVGLIVFFIIRRKRNTPKAPKEKKVKKEKKPKKTTSIAMETIEGRLITDVQIEKKIGGGHFGEVYKGLWRDVTPVALKKLKDEKQMAEFKKEAEILQKLANLNIVQFYGLYISEEGDQYMVSEYMSKGSLLDLLRSQEKTKLTVVDLLAMSRDAAAGMMYLHSMGIVHCDLAVRNLLVNSGNENQKYLVKVNDFGLSHIIANSELYTKTDSTALPVKWSSPEVLKFGKYSFASDVWSFAICLWEIFSFGVVPYPGVSSVETMALVEKGYIMEKPEMCPESVYEIMKECWNLDPAKRPSMTDICKRINAMYRAHTKNTSLEEDNTNVNNNNEEYYNSV